MPGAVQRPQPGGVTLDTSLPPRFVWHITWDQLRADGTQPEFSAVANYLIGKQYCPHIMWNPFTGYMEQYYPASLGGRALKYNNQDGSACVQVEVFFTPGCVVDGVRYDTVADTPLVGWEDLITWMESLGIPRVWPMGPPQWAGNSRDADIWNANAGHYGHCNSPGDSHTDPGPMPPLTGTISTQSATITPVQEDDMPYSEADLTRIIAAAVQPAHDVTRANIIKTLTDNTNAQHVETRKQAVSTTQAQHDVTRGYLRDSIPAAVLNKQFSLPDGTVTNLAGILTAIHATPVAGGATADPAAITQAIANTLSLQFTTK